MTCVEARGGVKLKIRRPNLIFFKKKKLYRYIEHQGFTYTTYALHLFSYLNSLLLPNSASFPFDKS